MTSTPSISRLLMRAWPRSASWSLRAPGDGSWLKTKTTSRHREVVGARGDGVR